MWSEILLAISLFDFFFQGIRTSQYHPVRYESKTTPRKRDNKDISRNYGSRKIVACFSRRWSLPGHSWPGTKEISIHWTLNRFKGSPPSFPTPFWIFSIELAQESPKYPSPNFPNADPGSSATPASSRIQPAITIFKSRITLHQVRFITFLPSNKWTLQRDLPAGLTSKDYLLQYVSKYSY